MEIKNMEIEDFLKGDVSCKIGDFFTYIGEHLNRPFSWLWRCFAFKKEYSYLTEKERFELEGKELRPFLRGRASRRVASWFYDVGRYVERPFWWLWSYFTWKKEYSYLTEKERQDLRDRCFDKAIKGLTDKEIKEIAETGDDEMITRRVFYKKAVLILICSFILGWCAHVLTVNLLFRHYESKPVVLGAVAYAQEKRQNYQVTIYNLFGRIVARFKGGVALWNRPELIKRLFIARFRPGSGVYIYRVYAPSGEYRQGKILIGDNPDPGK